MTDTDSFTSLLALIDNHLSKTSIQGSRSEENKDGFAVQIPSLSGGHTGTLSETRISPGQRLPIPSLSLSESPITNILAEQVANMLKAKEKRQKEEEIRKMEEETKKLAIHDDDDDDDSSDCVIDLMKALKTPCQPRTFMEKEKVLSSSSSLESLFEPKFIDCEDYPKKKSLTPEPMLPCTIDMSYMLKQKVRRGKCSAFGKVLISRYRPVAAPYLKSRVQNDIVRFNFQTKSPCDLIKEKLRKPYCYNSCQFDLPPELRN